ncbi:MAG: GNAT family N-acetyltransferase [Butyrivibrio sp.]|nr:GNAT family N-acetyltransferase [Butyrivibrio sp.]
MSTKEKILDAALTLFAENGLPYYKAVGFVPTDEEKTVNGIRFTPMAYRAEGRP